MVACALAAAPTPAPATLAPVLNHPYRVVFEDERSDPSGTRHFRLERTVQFRREADGYTADVTLVAVTTDAAGEFGRRFTVASNALKNRTVRFHLSPGGTVEGIDDEATVWAAVVAGVAAMTSSAASTGEFGERPEGPLAALPPAGARATLASILTPILAGGDVNAEPGSRKVALPRSPLSAAGAAVDAVEVVTLAPDGTLRLAVHADDNGAAMQRSIDHVRIIDRAHGLVRLDEKVQVTTVPGGTQRIRSRVLVTPPVS